jgi:hypothetical protein
MGGPLGSEQDLVGRLRVRCREQDHATARLRLARLFQGVRLHPRSLPAQAILCIRRLSGPHPGRLALSSAQIRPPDAWRHAVAGAIEAMSRHACRPWHEPVPGSADAVLFQDASEMLACLAMDWLAGVLADNWWWRELLKGTTPAALVAKQWMQAPELTPAAVEMMAGRSRAEEFVLRLPEDQVAPLLERMLRTHGVPEPSRAARASARDRSTRAPESDARQMLPSEPWLPFVPEASTPGLPPAKRVLLAQALMLRRAPGTARSIAFQRDVAEWRSWIAEQPVSRLASETEAHPDSPPKSRDASAAGHRSEHTASAETAAAVERTLPHLPRTEVPRAPASDSFPSEGAKTLARTTELSSVGVDQAEARDESQAPEPAVRERPRTERSDGTLTSAESAFGGVFFLLNVVLHLELYADFTSPRETSLELDIWDFICLMGLIFTGEQLIDDPLIEVLATLAGRTRRQPPGAGFEPPADWHVPVEWLKPFPEIFEWAEVASGGRLQVRHPAGFLLVDERREVRPELIANGDALPRWLNWIAGYIRARLVRGLGRDDACEFLCGIPARVSFTPAHVDVCYSLETYPIQIRLAGLDRDPGWVPAAGRLVTFHFE